MKTTGSTVPVFLLFLLLTACGGSEPDTTPPGPVEGVAVTAAGVSALVSWSPNPALDLSHYLLYVGTHPDSLNTDEEPITTTSCEAQDLTIGTRYLFGVTALDEAGNESIMSEVVDATPMDAAWQTEQGWASFQAEDYRGAIGHFGYAQVLDPEYGPAYLGEGWSQAFVGQLDLARTALEHARSLGLSTHDASAGLAVVLKLQGDLHRAIAEANSILTDEPAYVFSRRVSIDWRDLRLLIAQCWYRLGERHFDHVQAQVDLLDPDNGLDPMDPASWVVDGARFESYAIALLVELTRLEAILS